jgi:hypothetical protein
VRNKVVLIVSQNGTNVTHYSQRNPTHAGFSVRHLGRARIKVKVIHLKGGFHRDSDRAEDLKMQREPCNFCAPRAGLGRAVAAPSPSPPADTGMASMLRDETGLPPFGSAKGHRPSLHGEHINRDLKDFDEYRALAMALALNEGGKYGPSSKSAVQAALVGLPSDCVSSQTWDDWWVRDVICEIKMW